MKISRKLWLSVFIVFTLIVAYVYSHLRDQISILSQLTYAAVPTDESLRDLQVADNYRIEFFIPPGKQGVDSPRQIAIAEEGWVFIGSYEGVVYAAKDHDGDGQADVVRRITDDLNVPHGVAFHAGNLYIGAVSTIYVVDNILARLRRHEKTIPLKPLVEGLPDNSWHGTRHIKVGPDNFLYVSLGTPCNICLPPDADLTGVIRRYDINGQGGEVYARGIRNSVGFDWHPQTGEMWFTDNGRDWMGDNLPSDELNRISNAGQHFGYPYCHQGNLPDPRFGKRAECSEFVAPAWLTGPHVANLGMAFDPTGTYAYIALHGSWNHSQKVGYSVYRARIDKDKVQAFEPFIEGWLTKDKTVLGRPVDIAFTANGSMLITDDFTDSVYHISKKH